MAKDNDEFKRKVPEDDLPGEDAYRPAGSKRAYQSKDRIKEKWARLSPKQYREYMKAAWKIRM
ncbi:hypothetical protein ACLGL1_05815 [Peptococcus simiae]|uniref:hypothetical protein n=1 Tax=Peptococcus simiae TaxID=1643805 RepID=UPI0039809583